ncbi:hypothetical protein [Heyndrickxia acidicola]|uniref:Intracellular proteinase inhibitor BsuPI domain-containing protein n=1 Tax=Heyndrickxia acidicola TaxID=209389 RepID=A0ABU6MCU8_9BACI|nr:hypothetical protein [Heyndrickxia acidicola]MED1202493.1 hypothetical protein [Heyndrickxia acidicola]
MIGLLAVLLFQHQGYPLDSKKELEWEIRTTDTGSSLQLELIAENKSTTTVSLVFPTTKFFDFTIYDNGRVKIFT